MHLQLDTCDLVGTQSRIVSQLDASIDRRMNDDAAGKRLVGVREDLPAAAEVLGDFLVAMRCREHVGKPPGRLDCLVAAREVGARQERSQQAIARGVARMKRLAHGAEHLAEPRRLRGGNSEGPGHLLFVEPEEAPGGSRRAEDARRAGDVPSHVVVRRVHSVADAAGHFHAKNECVQELSACDASRFGIGEHCRRDRTARVDDGSQVRVIEIEGVRGDPVHQRREHDVDSLASPKHRRITRS